MARLTDKDFSSEKLPTLHQAMKMGKVHTKQYHVNTIWFPNSFPVLTLETDTFRFNVKQDTDLYILIMDEIDECLTNECSLFLEISSLKPLEMETIIKSQEKCEWLKLGETGWRSTNLKKASIPAKEKKTRTVAKKTQMENENS